MARTLTRSAVPSREGMKASMPESTDGRPHTKRSTSPAIPTAVCLPLCHRTQRTGTYCSTRISWRKVGQGHSRSRSFKVKVLRKISSLEPLCAETECTTLANFTGLLCWRQLLVDSLHKGSVKMCPCHNTMYIVPVRSNSPSSEGTGDEQHTVRKQKKRRSFRREKKKKAHESDSSLVTSPPWSDSEMGGSSIREWLVVTELWKHSLGWLRDKLGKKWRSKD